MNKNIAILQGGSSAEAEVSRKTASNVDNALKLKGYKTQLVELDNSFLPWIVKNKREIDIIFNALHGTWGEDGKLQGLLEYIKIPYTHSGVLSSALGMNKYLSKSIFLNNSIRVPKGKIVSKKALLQGDPFKRPFIIKPINEGSSVGIFLVKENISINNIMRNIKLDNFLVEEYIAGNDITVAIMDGKPIGMIEIFTEEDIYCFNAKYNSGKTKYVVPDYIKKITKKTLLNASEKSFNLLNCKGIARVDFRYDKNSKEEEVYLLEINTQPGLTTNSLFPKIAKNVGIDFPDLVEWIVNDAGVER